jgi:hypothetical protein
MLALGRHTFTVAGRGVGGCDLSPDVGTWTIAVSRPGMKTLTMRPERRPRIVTKSGS